MTSDRSTGIETQLGQIQERLDGVDKRLDGHDKRFDEVDKRFDEVDKRFDKLEQKVDDHYTEFVGFRDETRRSFSDLFAYLNDKFAETQRHIYMTNESHQGDISAVNDKLNGQADRLDEHDRDITILQGSHQDLHGRVAKLERK